MIIVIVHMNITHIWLTHDIFLDDFNVLDAYLLSYLLSSSMSQIKWARGDTCSAETQYNLRLEHMSLVRFYHDLSVLTKVLFELPNVHEKIVARARVGQSLSL